MFPPLYVKVSAVILIIMTFHTGDDMALAGIFQILHTPFADNGDIDWASYEDQITYCMAAGVHGLVTPVLASGICNPCRRQ